MRAQYILTIDYATALLRLHLFSPVHFVVQIFRLVKMDVSCTCWAYESHRAHQLEMFASGHKNGSANCRSGENMSSESRSAIRAMRLRKSLDMIKNKFEPQNFGCSCPTHKSCYTLNTGLISQMMLFIACTSCTNCVALVLPEANSLACDIFGQQPLYDISMVITDCRSCLKTSIVSKENAIYDINTERARQQKSSMCVVCFKTNPIYNSMLNILSKEYRITFGNNKVRYIGIHEILSKVDRNCESYSLIIDVVNSLFHIESKTCLGFL